MERQGGGNIVNVNEFCAILCDVSILSDHKCDSFSLIPCIIIWKQSSSNAPSVSCGDGGGH